MRWKGENFQCVEYPGPFRNASTRESSCTSGQNARGFEELFADDAEGIEYTLQY